MILVLNYGAKISIKKRLPLEKQISNMVGIEYNEPVFCV